MKTYLLLLTTIATLVGCDSGLAQDLVHDGEYRFLQAQYGEQWAKQDAVSDARLGEIRQANGGKRPNILYVLIDDVSFGTMGNRTLNYVTGIDTPNINEFAEQGMTVRILGGSGRSDSTRHSSPRPVSSCLRCGKLRYAPLGSSPS